MGALDYIQSLYPWFSPMGYSLGFALVLAHYVVGLSVGWVFDLIRKS